MGGSGQCAALVIFTFLLVPAGGFSYCRWSATGADIITPKCSIPSHRISFEADTFDRPLAACEPTAIPVPGAVWRRLKRRLATVRAAMLAPQRDMQPPATAVHRQARRRNLVRSSSSGRSEAADSLQLHGSFELTRRTSGSGRWRPGVARITSCVPLPLADDLEDASSSSGSTSTMPVDPADVIPCGVEATACLCHDTTAAANTQVKEVLTEDHLLQFASLLNEPSAVQMLQEHGAPGPVGNTEGSLYGAVDKQEQYHEGWEKVAQENKPGVHFWAWRRHVRKGLYMYKSRAVYERALPQQVVAFNFDDEFRHSWDDTSAVLRAIPAPSECTPGAALPSDDLVQRRAFGRSGFVYARAKFPPPMSSREYVYARRVWSRPDDGGVYAVSRSCEHPAPPPAGCRVVHVEDFASGLVIRATAGIDDHTAPAVETITIYFEDSHVRAGIVNMALRKALWPMILKNEAAFRRYQSADMLRSAVARGCSVVEDDPGDPAAAIVADGSNLSCRSDSNSSDSHCDKSAPAIVMTTAPELDAASVPGAGPLSCLPSMLLPTVSVLGTITQSCCPRAASRMRLTPLLYAAYLACWRYMTVAGAAATRARKLGRLHGMRVCLRLWRRTAALWLGSQRIAATALTAAAAAAQQLVSSTLSLLGDAHSFFSSKCKQKSWVLQACFSKLLQRLGQPTAIWRSLVGLERGLWADDASDAGSSDTATSSSVAGGSRHRGGPLAASRRGRRSGGPSRSLRLHDFGEDGKDGPVPHLKLPVLSVARSPEEAWCSSCGTPTGRGHGTAALSALPSFGLRKWLRGLAAVAVKAVAAQAAHRVLSKGGVVASVVRNSGSNNALFSRCGGYAGEYPPSSSSPEATPRAQNGIINATAAASFAHRREAAAAAFGAYGAYGAPAASCGPASGALTLFKGDADASSSDLAAGLGQSSARRRAYM